MILVGHCQLFAGTSFHSILAIYMNTKYSFDAGKTVRFPKARYGLRWRFRSQIACSGRKGFDWMVN